MYELYNLLVYFVWFLATFYMVFILLSLAVYKGKISVNEKKQKLLRKPLVSFVIPAYNEEATIADTISSLKKIKYDNVEFIILNDGSRDSTSKIVRRAIKGNKKFRFIDNKNNKGKARTLNQGIRLSKGEFIVCMDADSIVEPSIVSKVLPYFNSENVGAVTVTVEVNNPKNLLLKIIAIEFSLGLSLLLKLFSFLDIVYVTPGPFSIYRAKALREIGGFDPSNITEDHEIAFRLYKAGYKIRNSIEGRVYTTLPETFKGIFIQRRRWYSGAVLTLMQHRKMLFNRKYGLFSFFMPYNMLLIISGLLLFSFSIYLAITKLIREIIYYRYTNFDFFHKLTFDFNFLYYGRVNFLAITMFAFTILFILFGLALVKKKYKEHKVGIIGFSLFFILYQIFWFGAFYSVIRGGKIKWR